MPKDKASHLSRRERQLMEIVHRNGGATAQEVQDSLPDPPSSSAVRTLLRILEEKGHLKHEKDGARFVYLTTESREKASRSALKSVLTTFFGDSVENAVATLLEISDTNLSESELEKLQNIIKKARREGR